jgi:aspartyl/glutamyl-tRNA(Asn/Gln) amidotransferase C subunit
MKVVTLREDEPKKTLRAEDILSNAPEKSGNLFKVPPVL